ncbi:MAG: hypothetical protein CM1200mP39_29960 [Dehalococcoidia bacterium]|nr:MAG: hypothetical protein CM1200mP39_29960 [Dehalococcoidia bacterium]
MLKARSDGIEPVQLIEEMLSAHQRDFAGFIFNSIFITRPIQKKTVIFLRLFTAVSMKPATLPEESSGKPMIQMPRCSCQTGSSGASVPAAAARISMVTAVNHAVRPTPPVT